MIKECLLCGEKFETNRKNQKFCCEEHKNKYHEKNRKKRQYYLQCDQCGEWGHYSANRSKSRPLVFCSKSCQLKYMNKNKKLICLVCGKEFQPTNSKQITCSKICYRKYSINKDFYNKKENIGKQPPKKQRKKMKRINKICPVCGKEFLGTVQQTYCSSKCKQNSNKTKIIEICDNCGKEYEKIKNKYACNEHHFCSHSCCMDWEMKNNIINPLYSSIHKKINMLLDEMEIKYKNEVSYSIYRADIQLLNNNKTIEIMGKYWHGDCRIFPLNKINEKQKQCIEKDKRKKKFITKQGVQILYLWEEDIIKNIKLCKLLIELFLQEKLDNFHSSDYILKDDKLEKSQNIKQYIEQ